MAKFLDLEGLNYFWDKIKSWVQERFAYKSDLNQKQDKLRSGQNIKTINGQDITGPGNIEIQGGSGGTVNSVNGKTGNVVLSASDVGAIPTERTINGKALSSNITLNASDVNALPSSTTIPTKVSDLTNDSNFSSVIIDRKVSTGTNIADITIDGTTTQLYAPTSEGGSGEENIIESISVNGTQQTITNKNVDIAVPTKTSDLNNDSGFITGYTETDPTVPSWAKQQTKPSYSYSEIGNTPDLSGFITKSVNDLTNYYLKSETYTKAEVAALIGAIQQFHYEIYATLPQSGESNVLYLVGPTGSGSDRYEEYVYSNNTFTKIGDTSIDLSGYVTTSALNTALQSYTPTSNLATVATSGDYDDLTNKPTIPTVPVQDVTVGGTSVVLNGTAVIPQEVFVATYGTTTYAEVVAARNANKIVICNKGDYIYRADYISSASVFFSCRKGQVDFQQLVLTSSDSWSESWRTVENVSNKVSTISGNEADTTKYPNTKAVADALANYVLKSQTTGLLKNDGTVDTNTYLTQHQDISGKADKTTVASSMPSGGFLPNVVYNLGTLSGDTTFLMAAATDNTIANIWCWTFTTPSTAPTITWPAAITDWVGGSTPTINASKNYEVTVMNGLATIIES